MGSRNISSTFRSYRIFTKHLYVCKLDECVAEARRIGVHRARCTLSFKLSEEIQTAKKNEFTGKQYEKQYEIAVSLLSLQFESVGILRSQLFHQCHRQFPFQAGTAGWCPNVSTTCTRLARCWHVSIVLWLNYNWIYLRRSLYVLSEPPTM